MPRTKDVFELEGKTVGLVGLGNIGQQVAKRLQGFDVKVIYYDAFRRTPEEEARLNVRYVPFETLLETADVVSLHVPLNHDTQGMIDAKALARMKPKAILINTCRGEVVQEEALIDALRQGRILAAGLDTQARTCLIQQSVADPAQCDPHATQCGANCRQLPEALSQWLRQYSARGQWPAPVVGHSRNAGLVPRQ